jgi:hypothetical protein
MNPSSSSRFYHPHTTITSANAAWVSASILYTSTKTMAHRSSGLFSNSVEDEVIVSGSFPESNPFGRECKFDLPRGLRPRSCRLRAKEQMFASLFASLRD